MDSETGERKHSSKGLAMPLEQVDTLLAAASDIQAAVEKGEELSVNLSSNGLCVCLRSLGKTACTVCGTVAEDALLLRAPRRCHSLRPMHSIHHVCTPPTGGESRCRALKAAPS